MNLIDLETIDYDVPTQPVDNRNLPNDVFTAIHTSGSTGEPKLAGLTHLNGVNFIFYRQHTFKNIKQTIAATISTFDAFVYETLASLCNGTPVVLLNEEQIMNANAFSDTVCDYEDSFLFATPTKLRGYLNNCPTRDFIKHIRYLSVGGEIFPDELRESVRKENVNAEIFNIYGPTEATINVTEKSI